MSRQNNRERSDTGNGGAVTQANIAASAMATPFITEPKPHGRMTQYQHNRI